MFFQKSPKVSVCIPVFHTERFLEKCLESVKSQEIPEKTKNFLEIIVVDDGSKQNAREIIKRFSKNTKFPIKFIEHKKNLGLLETRRTAIYEAKGDFVFILDSDDFLPQNALKVLYEKAIETNADIVHGKADVFFYENIEKIAQKNSISIERIQNYKNGRDKKAKNVFLGELLDSAIIEGNLIEQNHNGFLWGKLFKKEVYLKALSHISPIFCTMMEDFIQYLWISKYSKKYVGIESIVYNYAIDTGISSNKKIEDISEWEKVCSTSSVFTAIFSEVQSHKENELFSSKQLEKIKYFCRAFLKNNILQLENVVSPEIKDEAKKLLEDYWGKSFVDNLSSQ